MPRPRSLSLFTSRASASASALACALALPACGDNLTVDPALAPAVAILSPRGGELVGASPARVRVRITDDGELARATLEAAGATIERGEVSRPDGGRPAATLRLTAAAMKRWIG